MSKSLRDRIEAARVEGVAAQQPPGCHQCPFDRAMFVDRPVGIVRTGGVEAAGIRGNSARKCQLIKAQQRQQGQAEDMLGGKRDISQARLVAVGVFPGVQGADGDVLRISGHVSCFATGWLVLARSGSLLLFH